MSDSGTDVGPLESLAARLLNRGIRESATARAQAAALEGRSLGLRVAPPGVRLRIAIAGGEARVLRDVEPADADLSGGPLGYQRLLWGDAHSALQDAQVEIHGDVELVERFSELFRSAGPDFEEILSRLVGDVVAHELGEAARGFASWSRSAAKSLARSLGEYLQEERRDVPGRSEMDEFLAGVDEFANGVDRLAARVDRLRGGQAG